MECLRDWLAYHRICWIHPKPAWELVQKAGDIHHLLHAPRCDLCPILDQEWSIIEQIRTGVDWNQADRDLGIIEKKGIRVIRLGAPDYPPLLKEIMDPPFLLFWRGLVLESVECIAVVGARRATPYGHEAVGLIVPGLVAAGQTIVSGLAFGIDAAAHRACLAGGGRTIGVLASGVDNITPVSHHKLGELVMSQGGMCSEVPIGMPAHQSHFLWRNRIISGMSRAILVVEAAVASGSLVTARHAADQGRAVFAVPGPITSALSAGCNQLLRDGATPCIDAGDILGGEKNGGHVSMLDANTAQLLKAVTDAPCTADQLGERLHMPIAQVLQLVTTLECAGMLTVRPGGYISGDIK